MKKRTKAFIVCGIVAAVVIAVSTPFVVSSVRDTKRINELSKTFDRHYSERIVAFEKENKRAKNVDIAFLGDSITEHYNVKKAYSQYKVLNRGISGDTTNGVITRLGVSVYEIQPKVTALLIGVNNIDTMMDNYETILKGFKENIPNMKVVLLSLTPMTGDYTYRNETAKKNNEKIKEFAQGYSYSYIDLYSSLLDQNTKELNKNYTIDGLHLNDNGYKIVTSLITPVLSELL